MSPTIMALFGFFLSMLFFNLVVFGNDSWFEQFIHSEIKDKDCDELKEYALSGDIGWDFAKVNYDLRCLN